MTSQYSGAACKTTNCQVLVSLTFVRDEVPMCVALRLFLPAEWTDDPARWRRAGEPGDRLVARTKLEIALEEVERLVAAGVRFGCVLADAGYGVSVSFRQALSARGLTWAVGITRSTRIFSADVSTAIPQPGVGQHHGRPRHRPQLGH